MCSVISTLHPRTPLQLNERNRQASSGQRDMGKNRLGIPSWIKSRASSGGGTWPSLLFPSWNMGLMSGSATAILWPWGRQPYTVKEEERKKELGALVNSLSHMSPSWVRGEKTKPLLTQGTVAGFSHVCSWDMTEPTLLPTELKHRTVLLQAALRKEIIT